ncbi:MAG TPA: peroxidase family protein, partial [Microlunatus sp.]|nr:peroxidase family protein [Microlunatus sp.]
MSHGSADNGVTTPSSTFYDRGRFGRLFPTLPAFSADTPTIRAALTEIGRPGGLMDAADELTDPVALVADPTKSSHNPNNADLTAGTTFLGQFLDHDLTFDPTSSLARRQDPESIRNFRIPALDLDSLYGGGPGVSPALYDRHVDQGRTTMLVEEIPGAAAVTVDGRPRYDVPRNSQGVAILGDPRNDENLILSQLHLAMLRFHNAVVGDVKDALGAVLTPEEVFTEAQRIVRWHYQWMIVHEFLPKTVGPETMADIAASGRRFYDWRNDPYIPVEFSVAAYRFGHSQVRPSYRANFGTSATDVSQQFFAMIFDHTLPAATDPADLRGGCR